MHEISLKMSNKWAPLILLIVWYYDLGLAETAPESEVSVKYIYLVLMPAFELCAYH